MIGDAISITKTGCLFRKPKFPVIGDFSGNVEAMNDLKDTMKIIKSVELVENNFNIVIDL